MESASDRAPPLRYITAPGAYAERRAALEVEKRCARARPYGDYLVARSDPDERVFDLRWWDRNHFLLELDEEGVTLRGERPEDCSEEWFNDYLTGPLLAAAIRLLGLPALHGSTVERDGRAMTLLGHSGDGKSTLTLSLAARGARVVADDLCVIDLDDGPRVRLGPRRVRLWPDTARALGLEDLPLIAPDWGKRFADERSLAFADAPPRLSLLVILTESGAPARLSPNEATLALLERVSAPYLSTRAMRARELELLARLVEEVPVFSLPRAPSAAQVGSRAEAALRLLEECT